MVAQCNAVELSTFWAGLLTDAAVGRKVAGCVADASVVETFKKYGIL